MGFGSIAAVFFAAPAVMLLMPRQAGSTTALMQNLPAFQKYQCRLCHTTAAPVPGVAPLNAFGDDYLANGNVWDATLAAMNSDGDRCTNGFELGDDDGDGVFDYGPNVIENGNPGDGADCTLPVDLNTWGMIKDIFSREIQQYLGDDGAPGTGEVFELYFP